ncbi:nucleotidyl transferase AbiEii/AbiGii toxin family protein [Salipiger mangrovisoli]|uniref:Nucleotidyl transferase AbiEii/AbiGii toxin family protein n=1 Tax=Salipiger mangrovisoli TaxID=2865933 RepID=A0ABR9X8L6_9RHOB|nr:nucleotidyl transferase AbiEii/AbiGii toxin family protein [Salipiger mangrovisoli]MBE9639858.1 nucleotidyl transferase AbiEii/AbiGii toxin family protein [Salipiger mangrovisoli]
MTDTYFDLAAADRQEVLEIAASASGRPVHLLEKDIWVVWCLETLFGSDIGAPLVFKGGTSLSKAYQVIKRFSEDVDLTYDIRELAPDLVADAPDTLPSSRSQESRWSKEARKRLVRWVGDAAAPFLAEALARVEPSGGIRVENDEIFIRYAARTPTSDYVRPEVKLEFGARATGEPNQFMPVACDAAPYVAEVLFPAANPRVMTAERTFWEKATAAHVYCKQGRLRGERFARHWYDLVRLAEAGYADTAIRDRRLANAVASHKAMFFREKDQGGQFIDYHAAVAGKLNIVPEGEARAALAEDYSRMVDDGLLIEAATPFDDLMKACSALEVASRRSVHE